LNLLKKAFLEELVVHRAPVVNGTGAVKSHEVQEEKHQKIDVFAFAHGNYDKFVLRILKQFVAAVPVHVNAFKKS